MALPSAKELKKLAKACRAAGIRHFKNAEIEFTLTDYVSEPAKKSVQKRNETSTMMSVMADDFETEELNQDALLFWSALPADSTGDSQPA